MANNDYIQNTYEALEKLVDNLKNDPNIIRDRERFWNKALSSYLTQIIEIIKKVLRVAPGMSNENRVILGLFAFNSLYREEKMRYYYFHFPLYDKKKDSQEIINLIVGSWYIRKAIEKGYIISLSKKLLESKISERMPAYFQYPHELSCQLPEKIGPVELEKMRSKIRQWNSNDINDLLTIDFEENLHSILHSSIKKIVEDKLDKIQSSPCWKNLSQILNRVHEDQKEAKKSLISFSLITHGLNHWYFIPSHGGLDMAKWGLILYSSKKIEDNELKKFQEIIEIINTVITSIENEAMNEDIRFYALRSAVAAIMARNMSHHLRSHVLSYVVREYFDEYKKLIRNVCDINQSQLSTFGEDNRLLLKYLAERMELISIIISHLPPFQSINFKRDVLDGKINEDKVKRKNGNNLILEYINKSDKICGENITRDKLKILFKDYETNENVNGSKTAARLNVALPGGTIGVHAFLTILEDIIRNAGKHGLLTKRSANRELVFKIDAPDFEKNPEDINDYDSNEFIKITITDNLENATDNSLTEKLNSILQEDLIAPDGRLIRENLGFKEMKICAAFLRGYPPYLINRNRVAESGPELIIADKDNANNLQYTLYLLKPKEILVLEKDNQNFHELKNNMDFKKFGIEVLSPEEIDWTKSLRFRFCLLNNELCLSNEQIKKLPCRLLYFDNEHIYLDNKKETPISSLMKDTTADKFLNALYNIFIKLFWGPELPQIVISYFPNNIAKKINNKNLFLNFSEINNPIENGAVFYDHFHVAPLVIEKEIKLKVVNPIFIESITGENSSKSKFEMLHEMESELVERFILELMEAALTKVLVFDERIFQFAEKVSYINIKKGLVCGDFKEGKLILLNNENSTTEISISYKNDKMSITGLSKNFDFITIHQGILDEIADKFCGDKNALIGKIIEALKCHAKFVMIHSGRGKPEYLPEGTIFFPYETLETLFFEDKHTLVQTLFYAKSGREYD